VIAEGTLFWAASSRPSCLRGEQKKPPTVYHLRGFVYPKAQVTARAQLRHHGR